MWSQSLHGANPSGIANNAGLQTDTGARNEITLSITTVLACILLVVDQVQRMVHHLSNHPIFCVTSTRSLAVAVLRKILRRNESKRTHSLPITNRQWAMPSRNKSSTKTVTTTDQVHEEEEEEDEEKPFFRSITPLPSSRYPHQLQIYFLLP